jgi:hypothetical protein
VQDELENQLSLFSKDEVETWMRHMLKQSAVDINLEFRTRVEEHSGVIVERFQHIGCKTEREQVRFFVWAFLFSNNHIPQSAHAPFNAQLLSPVGSVTSLISKATNIENLAKMTEMFNAWF